MINRESRANRDQTTILAGLAVSAAVAMIVAPWIRVVPLSTGLVAWLKHVLVLLDGGEAFIAVSESSTLLVPRLLIGLLFAFPFLSLPSRLAGRKGLTIGRIIGVLFLALSIPSFFVTSYNLADPMNWGGILAIAGTVLTGSLLLYLSILLRAAERKQGDTRCQVLMVLTGLTGTCLATYVLLPVGIILLVPTYVLLAVCLRRSGNAVRLAGRGREGANRLYQS